MFRKDHSRKLEKTGTNTMCDNDASLIIGFHQNKDGTTHETTITTTRQTIFECRGYFVWHGRDNVIIKCGIKVRMPWAEMQFMCIRKKDSAAGAIYIYHRAAGNGAVVARTSYGKCVDARHHYRVLSLLLHRLRHNCRDTRPQLDTGSCLSRVFPICVSSTWQLVIHTARINF